MVYCSLCIVSSLCGISYIFFQYLILSAALNLNIEHKSKSWKKLLLLPISRTRIFGDKGIFLLLQTIFSLLLFLATMIALGCLLGIIYPELKMLTYSPNLLFAFSFLGRVLMGSLAILSIHYVLSLFFENMIIPITAGIIGVIISVVISTKWKYAVYFPYSFLSLLYNDSFGKMAAEKWMGISISEWVSIALSVVAISVGAWIFNKKQLK